MKRLALMAGLLVLAESPIAAAESTAPSADQSAAAIIEEYCLNIRDKAAEARAALQLEALSNMEARLDSKIAELEARRAEVELWVGRQEAILKAANAGLVEIYAKMDPEAAALQLSEVGRSTAVSILSQLSPRNASAIMTVMEPARAADLVKALASPLAASKKGGG